MSERPLQLFSVSALMRAYSVGVVALIVSLLIQLPFRPLFYAPILLEHFGIRAIGCFVALAITCFLWERYCFFVIAGIITAYLLLDAPKIIGALPLDDIDWYPFKFLPLAWAKAAWIALSLSVTALASVMGALLARVVRRVTRPSSL